jgi:hypothetical protein
MSEAVLVEERAVDFRRAVRVDGAPDATAEAQIRAHDPALVSPEPAAGSLSKGTLS